VKDNKAHEQQESVFATCAVATMAFTRATSNGPHRNRHGGERRKFQLDFDVDENGGRKQNKTATSSVAHAFANVLPASKSKHVAKNAVTKKKKLVNKASVKKPTKKQMKKAPVKKVVSVKNASVNKSTHKDAL
jgi:hypothetical protein